MLTRNDNYKSTRNCYVGGNYVQYIVVHYTGCYAPAKNFCLSQMNNDLGGSAHDFVDDNEWYCPQCGNKDHSKMNLIRRTCGDENPRNLRLH